MWRAGMRAYQGKPLCFPGMELPTTSLGTRLFILVFLSLPEFLGIDSWWQMCVFILVCTALLLFGVLVCLIGFCKYLWCGPGQLCWFSKIGFLPFIQQVEYSYIYKNL